MKIKYLALSFFLIFALFLNAQSTGESKVFKQKSFEFLECAEKKLNHNNFFQVSSSAFSLASKSEFRLEKQVIGANQFTHYRYNQYHEGIPIYGADYILHEKDGIVQKANGRIEPFINTSVIPTISEKMAISIAKQKMQVQTTDYGDSEPIAELYLIDPAYPDKSEEIILAYKVDIECKSPFDKQRIFINASNGQFIGKFPLHMKHGVPSTVTTKYYGTQTIITDSIAPNNFLLRDYTRGEGISVLTGPESEVLSNNSSNWDFNSDENQVALDAHYCSQEFYDMMLTDYDWNGIDGKGGELRTLVRLRNNFSGIWDGSTVILGDGDCNHGPPTTLEIIGHEFMHGVIGNSSKLIYSGEPGGINECLADIFGKLLEQRSDSANFSWEVGHSFSMGLPPFRRMNDPNSLEMPALYQGLYWPTSDNQVHTYSAIGNLWFYRLVEGAIGTNEAGNDFDVQGVGFEKAGQIAFLTNATYLVGSSNYDDFYNASLAATEELYGIGSTEANAVVAAWNSVGIPSQQVGLEITDLSIRRSFSDNLLCADTDTELPVEIDIVNLGTTSYFPEMEGEVNLNAFGFTDYTLLISDTILPGERMTYIIDDWITLQAGQGFTLNVQLDFSLDENPNNDSFFENYQVAISNNNLSLFSQLANASCTSNIQKLSFQINNFSCSTIPEGTILSLDLSDGIQTIWSLEYELLNSLLPFQTVNETLDIDLSGVPDGELQLELSYTPDEVLFDNVALLNLQNRQVIDQVYLNTFDEDPLTDNALLIQSSTLPPTTINWSGENYFGATGRNSSYDFLDQCQDINSAFVGDLLGGGITKKLALCLDMTDVNDPVIAFDAIKFYNNLNGLPDFGTAMLEIAWGGTGAHSEIFVGELEGIESHYELNLPENFVGEVEFKFYTEIGTFQSLDTNLLASDDFVLLDNLEIKSSPVNTEDLKEATFLNIYPNPASNNFTISSAIPITKIEIYNLNNSLLNIFKGEGLTTDISIDKLSQGMILLKIKDVNERHYFRKILIIR